MPQRYDGRALGQELIKQGLVSPDCRNVSLEVPANGMLVLHYDVFVNADNLPKIIAALQALHERYAKEETVSVDGK